MLGINYTKAQIMAWLAPVVALVAGGLASWLFVHVQFLGIFHVTEGSAAQLIASGITFVVGAGLTWATIHLHVLDGAISNMRAGEKAISGQELLAMLTPVISVVAGALASWALVHLHWLGFFHTTQETLVQTIASALTFVVGAAITWAAANLHVLPIRFGVKQERRALAKNAQYKQPSGGVQTAHSGGVLGVGGGGA